MKVKNTIPISEGTSGFNLSTLPPSNLSTSAKRIAHLSDVHFGRIAHPLVVDVLVEEVNAGVDGHAFDLVVVSGDLTQRARTDEFEAAREMLDRFRAPVLVVPGNHDVPAWWHDPFERVFRSARRFRRFITDDLTPTFTADSLAVFGLNSAHGMTIKGGKIREAHLAAMERFFAGQPAEAFRVLVLHHHLRRLEEIGDHDVAQGARRALEAAGRAGVDLVLCGHLHVSHVAHAEVVPPGEADPGGHRIVIASAGTATSDRGRGHDPTANQYNWITARPGRGFWVEERRFDPTAGRFETARETPFAQADPSG